MLDFTWSAQPKHKTAAPTATTHSATCQSSSGGAGGRNGGAGGSIRLVLPTPLQPTRRVRRINMLRVCVPGKMQTSELTAVPQVSAHEQ